MWSRVRSKPLWIVGVAVAVLALLAVACGGGVSQKDYDAVKAQLAAKVPGTVIQAGQLQPAPAAAQLTGWDTPESVRGGLRVVATYDSSGPAAWDPVAHPLVYFTSEGKGYGSRPSKNAKILPGIQVIDANTKQIIAAPQYDLGYKAYSTPHNVAASPDGKWLYTYTNEGDAGTDGTHRLLIINAKTLKLHMMLTVKSHIFGMRRFHHIKAFKDWQGRDRVLVENQGPNGPKFILDPNDNNRVVRAITADEVGSFGHPNSSVGPDGKTLYIALHLPVERTDHIGGAVAKYDLEKGTITYIGQTGVYPNGFAHTSDGKFSYVADSGGDRVYKIDNTTNTLVGSTNAAVPGPYSLALNWNEQELWAMGKGETTFNLGGVLGLIDLKTFRARDMFYIGGKIIDHGTLHPDPNVNELWVSSAGTWETIVFDLTKREVKARIPSPNGGDTHSGAFVRYKADFTGEVLVDQGGPLSTMRAIMKANAAKVAAVLP